MALPNTFANQTSVNMQEFDQNYLAVANMGKWGTTATGTNSITLTPTANQPDVGAYANGQKFSFTAPNNSTGAVSLQVNAIGLLPLYAPSGAQAGSGTLASGSYYEIVYLSALNTGAGGFLIVSALPSSVVAPLALASARGLVVTNNGAVPSTKIDITANQLLSVTTGGTPDFKTGVSVTIDLTTTGANGMDTGARPTSGWVYAYLISTGSVVAGLASATSPTAGGPTMPGGYSYAFYAGAMYCDGSQNLLRSRQTGRTPQYRLVPSTNTAIPPTIDSGAKGSFSITSPTLVAVTVQGNGFVVPLTAGAITVAVSPVATNATASNVLVAPNTDWGGTNNGPNGSAGQVYPIFLSNGTTASVSARLGLEAATIAWCSSGAGGKLVCLGWDDYYVNA